MQAQQRIYMYAHTNWCLYVILNQKKKLCKLHLRFEKLICPDKLEDVMFPSVISEIDVFSIFFALCFTLFLSDGTTLLLYISKEFTLAWKQIYMLGDNLNFFADNQVNRLLQWFKPLLGILKPNYKLRIFKAFIYPKKSHAPKHTRASHTNERANALPVQNKRTATLQQDIYPESKTTLHNTMTPVFIYLIAMSNCWLLSSSIYPSCRCFSLY